MGPNHELLKPFWMDPVKKSDLKQNPTFFKQKLLCKHIEQRNDRNRTEELAHPSELVSDHQWRSAHYF